MVEKVQRGTRHKGVRAMSGRPMRVQASTAREKKRDEEQAKNDLRSCFPIKDLREAGFYLGCHITRNRDAGTLKFDQYHYIRTMASKFSVEKTITTPGAAGAKPLSKNDAPQTEAETEEMRVTPHVGCDHDPP